MSDLLVLLGRRLSSDLNASIEVAPDFDPQRDVGVRLRTKLYFSDQFVTSNLFDALASIGAPVSGQLTGDLSDIIAGPEYLRGKLDDENVTVLGRIVSVYPGEIQVEVQYEEPVEIAKAAKQDEDVESKTFIPHTLEGMTFDGRKCRIDGLIFNSKRFGFDGGVSRSGIATSVQVGEFKKAGSVSSLLLQGLRFFPEEFATYPDGETRREITTMSVPGATVVLRKYRDSRMVEARVSPATEFVRLEHALMKALSVASMSLVSWPILRTLNEFGDVISTTWNEVGRGGKKGEQFLSPLFDDHRLGAGVFRKFVSLYLSKASSLDQVEELALATIEMDRTELLESKVGLLRIVLARQMPKPPQGSYVFGYEEMLKHLTEQYKIDSSWVSLAPHLDAIERREGMPGTRFRAVLAGMEFAHHCFLRAIGWDGKFCSVLRFGNIVEVGQSFDSKLL